MRKELEKTYDPAQVEKRTYQFWLDGGYFHAVFQVTHRGLNAHACDAVGAHLGLGRHLAFHDEVCDDLGSGLLCALRVLHAVDEYLKVTVCHLALQCAHKRVEKEKDEGQGDRECHLAHGHVFVRLVLVDDDFAVVDAVIRAFARKVDVLFVHFFLA